MKKIKPTVIEIKKYLNKSDKIENYVLQERRRKDLFEIQKYFNQFLKLLYFGRIYFKSHTISYNN